MDPLRHDFTLGSPRLRSIGLLLLLSLLAGSASQIARGDTVTGTPGTDGTAGTGGAGTNGGPAVANSTNDIATATAGQGGNGGSGANGVNPGDNGSPGGRGGDGGSASATNLGNDGSITAGGGGGATAYAYGGNGGAGGAGGTGALPGATGQGGNGGSAISTATCLIDRGDYSGSSFATAIGGNAGGLGGNGGDATASASVTAGRLNSSSMATATGGSAGIGGISGQALATVSAAPLNGTGNPNTAIANSSGGMITKLTSQVVAIEGAQTSGQSYSAVGHPASDAPSSTAGYNAIAYSVGLPSAADVNAAIGSTTNVQAAFAHTLDLGLLTLSGQVIEHQPTAFSTSDVTFNLNTTNWDPAEHVTLGLFNPTGLASNFGQVELTITNEYNNSVVLDQKFTTLSAANAYFTDHVLDLGSLGSLGNDSSVASFDISLHVSGSLNNSMTFGSQMIVGAAVPEPSSLVLAALFAVPAGAWSLLRRAKRAGRCDLA